MLLLRLPDLTGQFKNALRGLCLSETGSLRGVFPLGGPPVCVSSRQSDTGTMTPHADMVASFAYFKMSVRNAIQTWGGGVMWQRE